jgi:hypothetical protein
VHHTRYLPTARDLRRFFRRRHAGLNLLRTPQTNANGHLNARNLAAGGVVLPALYLPVINMSKAIIRLSIPIGTIAISSVAIFAFSWVGLALLGF